jgi:DNA adenine methylase
MPSAATPLRYPGGKQKIWRFIAEIIKVNDLTGCDYVEPYAGGAGVAVELLLSGVVRKIHLNDNNPAIYAFWHSILNHTDEFCRKIANASLSVKEWERQRIIYKDPDNHDPLSLGFSLFYLSRCNRSGILTAGVIGGKNQTGTWKIDARFNRNDLIQRIERIAAKKKFIKVKNIDAEKLIISYINKIKYPTLTYCDPPYFAKAERLYNNTYSPDDHLRLSDLIKNKLTSFWIVSYDNAPEILSLYESKKCFTYPLQYNASRVYKGTELFIFCNSLSLPRSSTIPYIHQALEFLTISSGQRKLV